MTTIKRGEITHHVCFHQFLAVTGRHGGVSKERVKVLTLSKDGDHQRHEIMQPRQCGTVQAEGQVTPSGPSDQVASHRADPPRASEPRSRVTCCAHWAGSSWVRSKVRRGDLTGQAMEDEKDLAVQNPVTESQDDGDNSGPAAAVDEETGDGGELFDEEGRHAVNPGADGGSWTRDDDTGTDYHHVAVKADPRVWNRGGGADRCQRRFYRRGSGVGYTTSNSVSHRGCVRGLHQPRHPRHDPVRSREGVRGGLCGPVLLVCVSDYRISVGVVQGVAVARGGSVVKRGELYI